MYFSNRIPNPRARLSIGTFYLAASGLLWLFIRPSGYLQKDFVDGVSGFLLGLSIVFIISGFMLTRRRSRPPTPTETSPAPRP